MKLAYHSKLKSNTKAEEAQKQNGGRYRYRKKRLRKKKSGKKRGDL